MSASARRAMAEFAAAHHGVIDRTQAVRFGLTPRQIRTAKLEGWLDEPHRGVLVIAGHPPTWEQRLAIATSIGNRGAVVSHGAAARLFALEGFDGAEPELSVVRPGRLRVAHRGIVVHHVDRIEGCDRVERTGLPCTGLARTLVDLGSVRDEDAVWRALISARRLHRLHPLWLQQTARRLHRPGQRGTGIALRLLERWSEEGVLPESWFEELVVRMLNRRDIPPIARQYVLTDERGGFVARFDLAVPSAKLAIEAHSRAFHFGPVREAADEDRDLRIARSGWEVLYLGWYATRTPAEVAATVAAICRQRVGVVSRGVR